MLEIALALALMAVPVAIWTPIFRQAGYSGLLGLTALIPGAVFILPLAIGVLDWPIRKELARLRAAISEGNNADLARLPQGV